MTPKRGPLALLQACLRGLETERNSQLQGTKSFHCLRAFGALIALSAFLVFGACARSNRGIENGKVSQGQVDLYVKKAIRSSSDGVILLPSRRAAGHFDQARLREISQKIRLPAAGCFLDRAINNMRRREGEGRVEYDNVPNGQAKIRTRIGLDGEVIRTETLESGFKDVAMEDCLREAISTFVFPVMRDGFGYHIDVIYWVSLGFFEGVDDPAFQLHLRKEQARAGTRGKGCLKGRASPGEYQVEGLNLFDREGRSVANRVNHGELSADISACLVQVFKGIRIPPEPHAFLRPVSPQVAFTVSDSGEISSGDAEWLRLVELEERMLREQRRRELTGAGKDGEGGTVGLVPAPTPVSPASEAAIPETSKKEKAEAPPGDGTNNGEAGGIQLSPRGTHASDSESKSGED